MSKFFSFILLLFFSAGLWAQVVSDAKLWSSITLEKKVNDFEFGLNQEFRLDENFGHVDKFFTELSAKYEIIDNFSAGLAYRFDRDNDYETKNYDLSQRIDFSLFYKQKFEDLKLSYRVKYQTKTAHPTKNNPTYLRNKLTVTYDLNDFSPYFSYEFFYQFNDQNIINRNRTSIGSKYKINKRNSVKAYYLFENRFNTDNLEHNHIWGVGYTIEI